ncbi:MAG: hypothetical protein K2H30_06015 [Clostridia bacterium]|nr:hypothetical protein [Clostridia bacterium]
MNLLSTVRAAKGANPFFRAINRLSAFADKRFIFFAVMRDLVAVVAVRRALVLKQVKTKSRKFNASRFLFLSFVSSAE